MKRRTFLQSVCALLGIGMFRSSIADEVPSLHTHQFPYGFAVPNDNGLIEVKYIFEATKTWYQWFHCNCNEYNGVGEGRLDNPAWIDHIKCIYGLPDTFTLGASFGGCCGRIWTDHEKKMMRFWVQGTVDANDNHQWVRGRLYSFYRPDITPKTRPILFCNNALICRLLGYKCETWLKNIEDWHFVDEPAKEIEGNKGCVKLADTKFIKVVDTRLPLM